MQTVKDAIEELIEESYLLTLSKEEIEAELDRFFEVCERAIIENIQDIGRRRRLFRRMAAIQAVTDESDSGSRKIIQLLFQKVRNHREKENRVEKVARIKRTVIKAIGCYEPHLVLLIEHDLAHRNVFSPSSRGTEFKWSITRSKAWKFLGIAVFIILATALSVLLGTKG